MTRSPAILLTTMLACGTAPPVDTAHSHDSAAPPDAIAPLSVCINEVLAQSEGSWRDDSGAYPDWIELHNPTPQPLQLDGYFFTDNAENPYKFPLDAALQIEPGGFLVLAADGQPELGPTHLPFALSAAGESLGLYRFDGAGELLTFGPAQPDYAWSRETDCCATADCFAQVLGGTPAYTNGGT